MFGIVRPSAPFRGVFDDGDIGFDTPGGPRTFTFGARATNPVHQWPEPKRPGPEWIVIKTPSGERRFKFGARLTKPEHQGAPDPEKYHHPASTEMLDGAEARNLDRAHPGKADGTLTERISYAIVQLLKFDPGTGVCTARESAEGGPLVAGLPYSSHEILARVRRTAA